MDQSGAEDCFSRSRVMGDLEVWPSITWTVLSGSDAVFSRPVAIG